MENFFVNILQERKHKQPHTTQNQPINTCIIIYYIIMVGPVLDHIYTVVIEYLYIMWFYY